MRNRDRTLICGHTPRDRYARNGELKAMALVNFGEIDWGRLFMAYLSNVCPQIAIACPNPRKGT